MQLLTTKNICNILKISINTLNRWRNNPTINFPKPLKFQPNNGKTLWIDSDIEEWIKSNK